MENKTKSGLNACKKQELIDIILRKDDVEKTLRNELNEKVNKFNELTKILEAKDDIIRDRTNDIVISNKELEDKDTQIKTLANSLKISQNNNDIIHKELTNANRKTIELESGLDIQASYITNLKRRFTIVCICAILCFIFALIGLFI